MEGVTEVAAVQEQLLRKWNLPAGGLFTLRAPANTGIKISIDGQLFLDATGTRSDDVGQMITALVTLAAGDHVVKITGVSEENISVAQITINAAGEDPLPFYALTTDVDPNEAAQIVASRAVLNPAISGATTTAGLATSNGIVPFSIGGGSSNNASFARSVAENPQAAQMAAAANPIAAMLPGSQMQGGSAAGTRTSAVTAGGVSSVGTTSAGTSGIAGTPVSAGGGGFSGGGSGGGSAPVVSPGATPAPTPVTVTPPAPTPAPAPAPAPMGLTQVSPLTPPANVPLTQAIQLISAGNEEGMVANTGATLFGAAMDNSLFNVVNVAIAPTNRTTKVDIGAETGQFAVRLFEEDFAQGSEVTVTLTGALEGNDEVQGTPVTYTVRGMGVDNGISQALSRMTYGPTPELYARIRAIGFPAFVEEQLNPAAIDDSAFMATNPASLLNPTTNNTGTLLRSLMAHDIAHAAFSERQFQEVMANFWANHFHAITKDTGIVQQNITDRAFFRANAFGNFEDMLLYSARSPLMSQYLDNDQNRAGNINENYGREIMELSTVGVDAGYGPEDVIAVSRIFTGWGYTQTNPNAQDVAREYAFEFRAYRHDTDDKDIPFLGITIPGRDGAAGVQEGEELIAILAQHSSTRNFVCGKLVQLLVSDEPQPALTAACAAAWEQSGGEVVPMLRAILLDPSFAQNVAFQRSKSKTPFEYAVSAIRAFGATPPADRTDDFYRRFREMFEGAGYQILEYPNPTGLAEVGSAWTNSATLVSMYERMNGIAESRQNYGIDLLADIQEAGLETAEEVAAYLLAVSTADRFTLTEYEQLVAVLKDTDGIFEPRTEGVDETRALERAMGLIAVTPSFLLQ